MSHANISIFIPHAGCPHTCIFCNQHKISGFIKVPDIIAIRAELSAAVSKLSHPENTQRKIEIAYFGGSFTCLPRETVTELLEVAAEYVNKYRLAGIRISTRPDAIDEEIINILNRYGVTAVELGAQSLDDSVLKTAERGHSASDVKNAVQLLKEHFRGEIGLQMMTGLPGATPDSDRETAAKIIALSPDTVRIYPTVIISGTKLDELYQTGTYKPIAFDEMVSLVADITVMFENAGVRIIRTGLHASVELETQITGGFYHPAFGELVESEIFYRNVHEKLTDKGDYHIFVHPKNISKMIGHRKKNILKFAENGYNIIIKPDVNISANGREVVINR
jgi:histone acetyltransferase (RNA polymerase elongator complex component)